MSVFADVDGSETPDSPKGLMIQAYVFYQFNCKLDQHDLMVVTEFLKGADPPIENRNDERLAQVFALLDHMPKHQEVFQQLMGPGSNVPTAIGKFPLPAGKDFHFFICHHQSSGGNQSMILHDRLQERGYSVWYDNGVAAEERNLEGMRKGVRRSACVLIFLSGRKETKRKADQHGEYEGPFTRWFCHEEMAAAHKAAVPFIGVQEPKDEHDKPDMALEKSRARTGNGKGPVSPHVEQNLQLLDEVNFIPFERQKHLVPAMLNEIQRLASIAKPRLVSCACPECKINV